MRLMSGSWGKTYASLISDFPKTYASMNIDKKFTDSLKDHKRVVENLKKADKLINGFAMARDGNREPFLEPYTGAVTVCKTSHKAFAGKLKTNYNKYRPKAKVMQKTFDTSYTVLVKDLQTLVDQAESQIKGMKQEIKGDEAKAEKSAKAIIDLQGKEEKHYKAFFKWKEQLEKKADIKKWNAEFPKMIKPLDKAYGAASLWAKNNKKLKNKEFLKAYKALKPLLGQYKVKEDADKEALQEKMDIYHNPVIDCSRELGKMEIKDDKKPKVSV
ncbi:hypothetical protein [Neptunicoccus cionae]|uniref:DUF3829 domain-containing protein n=1 Tax=Neptunicoccus cionae TaxID=2035344 RepID=A0A916QYS3_9RHOB|nr:hypothetical protein [Amylibacter cionae]GGA22083.1 hypothetical protein GCM10011498_23540 [Amylibacter cionae]